MYHVTFHFGDSWLNAKMELGHVMALRAKFDDLARGKNLSSIFVFHDKINKKEVQINLNRVDYFTVTELSE